jgi:hypothetical protein
MNVHRCTPRALVGRAGLLVASVALAACETVSVPAQRGRPTDVFVVDGTHVEFDDERVPIEAFLLAMRQRTRAANGDADAMPWVRLKLGPDVPTDGRVLERILRELGIAGVRSITVG